jgi:MFS family permease
MWNTKTRALMIGSTLASFGVWIDVLAILTLASHQYEGGAILMAIVSSLFLLPGIFCGPLIGHWTDRSSVWPTIVLSLALRSLMTAMLLFSPSVITFCVIVGLRSLVSLPADVGSNVLVRRVVEEKYVEKFFSVLSIFRNASKIMAPAIGTVLASKFGEGHAIYVSIGLSVVALGFFLIAWKNSLKREHNFAQQEKVTPTTPEQSTPTTSTRAIDQQLFIKFAVTVTIYGFMVFSLNNQLPFLLYQAGFDKALLGILVSCSGAGGIFAATLMARRSLRSENNDDAMRLTTWSVVMSACMFVSLGFIFALPKSIVPYAASLGFFLTGILSSVEAIRANTMIVKHFPENVGSVSGKVQSLQNVAMLIAPWIAATVIPLISMSALFVLAGTIALVALSLLSMYSRQNR